jgi:putative DNA primase/helicase
MNLTEQFRLAMRRAGLDCAGPINADGKLHRIKARGDHAANSWYVLHPGPPVAGAFGCWKRGIKETWCARDSTQRSQRDWSTIQERWRDAERQRIEAQSGLEAKARKVAARVLADVTRADNHAYLIRKGVKAHGQLSQSRGLLILPLRDGEGTLHSLQLIAPDGTKRFLKGGRVAGCFFRLAERTVGPLLICEGYATGASVHEATGHATVAALNCGNLLAVARALRAKCPDREIIIAADNDARMAGNPGLTKATEAATAVGGKLAVPKFQNTATKPTDFNDLAALEGLQTVKEQIDNADAPKETDEQVYERLAKLPRADYDRCRDSEAKRIGVRFATLDQEVEKRRQGPSAAGHALQGFAIDLPSPEPWCDAVDGETVLAEVADRFGHYVALPPCAADVLALFTAGCHAFEAFNVFPRLNVSSPEKQCGKSTLLDVIEVLAPRTLRTESTTPAVLFRLTAKCKPTLLLDEVDTYLKDAAELRGLLNAGHKRGALATRCEGENSEPRGFPCFCPAVLAGIGHLPGTLHDRSIHIPLTRAKPGEIAARFDSRHVDTERDLCRKLARWTAGNFARLEACDPKLPQAAQNRTADNWRPLFAIAEIAGGDWPRRVAEAFRKLTSNDDQEAQGIGTLLLSDIAAIFAASAPDKLPSAKIAGALAEMEGRPWAEFGKQRKPITVNQLASQLRHFGITPRTIKLTNDQTAKGYHREDFQEAWGRFLPNTPLPDRNPVTTSVNPGDSALFETSPAKTGLRSENSIPPRENAAGYEVTDQKPQAPELAAQADLL